MAVKLLVWLLNPQVIKETLNIAKIKQRRDPSSEMRRRL